MTVTVVIPYRERGHWEHRLFLYCHARWREHMPDWELLVDDGGIPPGEPFNRSRARNAGAARSSGDVIVFANADTTFLDPEEMRLSVAHAQAGTTWTLAAVYVECQEWFTQQILDGAPMQMPKPMDRRRVLSTSPAGPQVILRSWWEEAGRFDEGFQGWGWEDAAFRDAADTLAGQHMRHGTFIHLWHKPADDATSAHPGFASMRARGNEYHQARNQGPQTMRRLIDHRNASQ